jgi:hypothetical protein
MTELAGFRPRDWRFSAAPRPANGAVLRFPPLVCAPLNADLLAGREVGHGGDGLQCVRRRGGPGVRRHLGGGGRGIRTWGAGRQVPPSRARSATLRRWTSCGPLCAGRSRTRRSRSLFTNEQTVRERWPV